MQMKENQNIFYNPAGRKAFLGRSQNLYIHKIGDQ